MKTLLFLLAVSFAVSASAVPDPTPNPIPFPTMTPIPIPIAPLLVKETSNGAVAPPYHYSTQCQLFLDRMVNTLTAGDVASVTTTPIQLSNSIEKALYEASLGNISTPGSIPPVGAGQQNWYGYVWDSTGTAKKVVLQSRVTMVEDNSSPEAKSLVNLLDLTCK